MVQTDKVLEFDKMKEKWIELALTEWAKEKIKDTVPSMSENASKRLLKETVYPFHSLKIWKNPLLL